MDISRLDDQFSESTALGWKKKNSILQKLMMMILEMTWKSDDSQWKEGRWKWNGGEITFGFHAHSVSIILCNKWAIMRWYR